MNVGIIGCGLIGHKRAKALKNATLVATSDLDPQRAAQLAQQYGAQTAESWEALVARPDIDIVIVSTTNDALAAVTLGAIQAGKHVLVEKPVGRNVAELEPLIQAQKETGVKVRVGFNHRYHPAFVKARKMILEEGIGGELMFIRGRYGHGGRVGYDREWRADPALSGGGELIDQGVHLIDLSRVFMGDFTSIDGFATTYFWDMPVDDNGFMMLRTASNQTAWLQVSCTEWKNMFSFEIYLKTAKIVIDGLGGSYGTERLTYYQMLPEMGPPDTTIWEYPRGDKSWELEFNAFLEDITLDREPDANLDAARATLVVVEEIYKKST